MTISTTTHPTNSNSKKMAAPKVSRKHTKIGLAALAVVALVIGLSVGLTAKNRANKIVSASSAAETMYVDNVDADKEEELPECSIYKTWSSRSGSKGSKSSSSSSSGDSGGRELIVRSPNAVANGGRRRKLRNELLRELHGRRLQHVLPLGTDAPPNEVGGFPIQAFLPDNRPLSNYVSTVPTGTGSEEIGFTPGLSHAHTVNGSGPWPWSHGYKGDVYFTSRRELSFTISLPECTDAFVWYMEPQWFVGVHEFTISYDDGQSVTESIDLSSGAKGYAVFKHDGYGYPKMISIQAEASSEGFAAGEFYIGDTTCPPSMAPSISDQPSAVSKSGSSKSGSSKSSKSSSMDECICPSEYSTTTGHSGKSGKSGSGKSGKSGSKSSSSGDGDGAGTTTSTTTTTTSTSTTTTTATGGSDGGNESSSSSKSSKSGSSGSKSSKSSGSKSSKSGGPTVCVPTKKPTPPTPTTTTTSTTTTPPPQCKCRDNAWQSNDDFGFSHCVRKNACPLNGDMLSTISGDNEYDDLTECCLGYYDFALCVLYSEDECCECEDNSYFPSQAVLCGRSKVCDEDVEDALPGDLKFYETKNECCEGYDEVDQRSCELFLPDLDQCLTTKPDDESTTTTTTIGNLPPKTVPPFVTVPLNPTPVPTPGLTPGSTPTVSSEKTGPPTKETKDRVD